jgi:hypothetical protein
MSASPWDMSNWFNWYWWVPDDKAKINPEEDNIDSIDDEIFQKEEIIPTEKPKPKRKRKTVSKKVSTKSQDAIELILRPTILEELEKEAIISDSTINQVIQVILESHIDSKGSDNLPTEVWKCSYCEPEREFRVYFDFSDHFFKEHMQPGLKKISEFNKKEQ